MASLFARVSVLMAEREELHGSGVEASPGSNGAQKHVSEYKQLACLAIEIMSPLSSIVYRMLSYATPDSMLHVCMRG